MRKMGHAFSPVRLEESTALHTVKMADSRVSEKPFF